MDVGSLSNLCWSLSRAISNLWGLRWLYLCVCLPFPPWITCLEFKMLPLKALWVFCFDPLARWWSFKRTLFRAHDFRHVFSFHTRLSTSNFPYSKPCQEGIDSHSRTPSHTRILQRTVNSKITRQPESKVSDSLKWNVEGIWKDEMEAWAHWSLLRLANSTHGNTSY